MQTFLPYPSFTASAACLDNKRLGKQRVEARQILKALRFGGGWANHPAVKMWKGFENALTVYSDYCILEWVSRGFNNTMPILMLMPDGSYPKWKFIPNPEWLTHSLDFCASHRSNLLRKLPLHYSQFGWTEPDDMPYVWPVR